MSEAPELDNLPRGASQWELIGREFRKRRLAVWSMRGILLLALISIFAPLIANDRPLAFRGWNSNAYNEARKSSVALIGQLASPPVNDGEDRSNIDRHKTLANVLERLHDMQAALAEPHRSELRALASELPAAVAASSASDLKRIQASLSNFVVSRVEFVSAWHFPVFAMLDGIDMGFMVLALLVLSYPLWSSILRRLRPTAAAPGRLATILFVALPVLGGGIWWFTVPSQNDLTKYKRGLMAANDSAELRRAPVVYETVMWPPIPYGVDENNLGARKFAPNWWPNRDADRELDRNQIDNGLPEVATHLLGTDNLGRDITSRMIWGGRVSLAVGVVAVTIYVTIGVILGALAGYFRGFVDLAISRIIEVMICFPTFFLILAVVSFLGQSMIIIMVVIGITSWPGVARLVRAEFLRLSEQEFVLAGRVLGYHPLRLIFRHVLPNALAPVLVAATFGVAGAILTESALSFLGLGITIPKPSWGGILADGRDNIFSGEWIILFPGLAIFLTITFYNLVGEAFRDAADPRLRGSR